MLSIKERNVNGVFQKAMDILVRRGVKEDSRNGPVTVYPEPVAVTYTSPHERVLFSPRRRANPFFHLFEAFWMLAGRSDAAFLNRYVHDFEKRYAEDNGLLHGAYGARWRSWLSQDPQENSFDQIEWAVDHLLREPGSRRAVIQMYDPSLDSTAAGVEPPRDIPCNTTIYLRIMGNRQSLWGAERTLDLTVCCRSNDAIWGAYGANAVHFSILQEYLAFRLDCGVGSMHQLSNNLHVYDSTLHLYNSMEEGFDLYSKYKVASTSLFYGCEAGVFERELGRWLNHPSNGTMWKYFSPVFGDLLIPMSRAHDCIREKRWNAALAELDQVMHGDWKEAAIQWIYGRPEISK